MVDLKFALWYAVRPEHSREVELKIVQLKHLCSYTVFGLTAYSKKVESLKQRRLAHLSIDSPCRERVQLLSFE